MVVPDEIRAQLVAHARREAPNEACGLIAFRDSVAGVRALLDQEAIFAGISSGAVVHVARELGAELDDGVVVCVLADGGWKYLSASFWAAEDVEAAMETSIWW